MSFLDLIKNEPDARGMRVVILGSPGSGKTSFAAQAPDPLIVTTQGEDGVVTLMTSGIIKKVDYIDQINSFSGFEKLINELRETDDVPYKSIVIDTVNGLAVGCIKETCDQHYGGDMQKFQAYGAGYQVAAERWRKLFYDIEQLRLEKGLHIFAPCHVKIGNFSNPSGGDFSRYQPDMHKALWPCVERWADAILFIDNVIVVAKEGLRSKGRGGTERIIHTEGQASFIAKNRYGLPSLISAGKTPQEAWSNFKTALGSS